MKLSKFTKSCRRKLWLCRILNWVCLYTPIFTYIIIALANDGIGVTQKVSVLSMLIIATIFTVCNLFLQKKMRCPIWILLIGLYIAISEWLMPLVIMLAVTSILDDLLFTPLIKYYYTKTVSSKTIDEREEWKEKDKK